MSLTELGSVLRMRSQVSFCRQGGNGDKSTPSPQEHHPVITVPSHRAAILMFKKTQNTPHTRVVFQDDYVPVTAKASGVSFLSLM